MIGRLLLSFESRITKAKQKYLLSQISHGGGGVPQSVVIVELIVPKTFSSEKIR